MSKVRKIAVITSGGDSPGMNACIRAITRKSIANNIKVLGFLDGYNGLIDNEFIELNYKSVSNIIHRGGTILGTARSERFLEEKYRKIAYKTIKDNKIDCLIVIGGDGSYKGMVLFENEFNVPYIGIPGTIDNDIEGTDYTIGFDTALNNIIQAVDKIKDTASSHHRVFLIEVMGNLSGSLALKSALTTGAEDVFIPIHKEDYVRFENKIKLANQHKKSSIIIVSEGDENGGAMNLLEYLKSKNLDKKVKVTILGHIQRGGSPSFRDRELATLFGAKSIELIIANYINKIIGHRKNEIISYQYSSKKNDVIINNYYLDLINDLSVY